MGRPERAQENSPGRADASPGSLYPHPQGALKGRHNMLSNVSPLPGLILIVVPPPRAGRPLPGAILFCPSGAGLSLKNIRETGSATVSDGRP
jgi:hypothetical protein